MSPGPLLNGGEQQSAAEATFFSPQGLSFHLGAVLLSLGFITYVEHGMESRLAPLPLAAGPLSLVTFPPSSSEEEAGVHLQRLYPEQTLRLRLQTSAQEGLSPSPLTLL